MGVCLGAALGRYGAVFGIEFGRKFKSCSYITTDICSIVCHVMRRERYNAKLFVHSGAIHYVGEIMINLRGNDRKAKRRYF